MNFPAFFSAGRSVFCSPGLPVSSGPANSFEFAESPLIILRSNVDEKDDPGSGRDGMKTAEEILVVGIGNEYRGDDAFGILVARRLRAPAGGFCRIVEHSGEGASLLELFRDRGKVILLDAVRAGRPPGTVVRLDASKRRIPARFFQYSTHEFGLAEAVELARELEQLPRKLVIFGVAGRNFGMGDPVSEEVRKAVPRVAGEVLQLVQRWREEEEDGLGA